MTLHVDDLKASHKYPFLATNFATYLSLIYVKDIKVNRGKLHDYFGINLEYSEDGKVKISMITYVQNILYDFPE